MTLPLAIIFIVAFAAIALFLIFRKSGGKRERHRKPNLSGNEKKVIKGK